MTKIVKKWQSQKILVEKFFLVGIDSECFETYFKTKISNRESFPCKFFFLGLSRFSAKMAKLAKKWQRQKILVEFFLVGIDSECFETYFKTKISKSKIFSRVKFFSLDFVFFGQNDQKSEKMTKSKHFGRKYFWSESIQNILQCILKR